VSTGQEAHHPPVGFDGGRDGVPDILRSTLEGYRSCHVDFSRLTGAGTHPRRDWELPDAHLERLRVRWMDDHTIEDDLLAADDAFLRHGARRACGKRQRSNEKGSPECGSSANHGPLRLPQV
jgi:hypothetical protein